jgi:hypothetical protein
MRMGGFAAAAALVAVLAQPAFADKKAASEHFALAEQAEKRKDWRTAIDEYEQSYAAEPHAAMLYNIARNYERLEEGRNAADYYRRYLAESENASDRSKVEQRIRDLRERASRVEVAAVPEGAAVFVDDSRVGEAPFRGTLTAGEHEIYVAHQGRTSRIKTVTAEYGEPQMVRFDLTRKAGFLVIRSNVDGAEVMLDGELIGRTPFSGPVISGKHQLVITRDGYQTSQREIEIYAGGSEQIQANLTRIPGAALPPEPSKPPAWVFGFGYGYDGIDESMRFALGFGVRVKERIELSAMIGALGPGRTGGGVESRLFFKTEGMRPYIRAAGLVMSSEDGLERQRHLGVEAGAGVLFSMGSRLASAAYYLEVDVQAVFGDLPARADDPMETVSRVTIPVSFGILWSFGGAQPQR